jgi:pimeloyl-ACP methyl ester carboxylesterase
MEVMPIPRRVVTRVATLSALTLAVALTACSSGTAGPAPVASGSAGSGTGTPAVVPAAATALHWQPCGGQLAGLECTSMQVPLNYADPNGRKITIALSMVPATAPRSQQQGVLLVNPGGPGEPGRSLAGVVATGLDPQVAADYDIVGFDPRGVGGSVPALSCDPGFYSGDLPDYIPANAAAEQVLINRAKTYAADCEQRFGWLLPYMTSENMARDMDQIRQAFGVQKINYYGFSWGTYLGQVYGTLFPGHVRRMVLDSTVDPTGAWYADNISQDYAFQARLNAFFAWTAQYDGTYNLGSTAADVRNAFYRARDALEANPVSGPDGQPIGPDEFDDTYLIGGYLNTTWPGLAQALSQYITTGSASGLVTQYEEWGTQQEDEPVQAVYTAVECADVNWPRSWAKWQADATRVYTTAPFMAWDNTWDNASCAFWPVKGPAKPFQVNGAGLPPVLMLQGTLDAATPYAGAQDAHKLLPSARMVVVTGGGNHGQSMESPPNTCIQNYLNNYLASGVVPNAPGLVNATCPAVPDPTPGS